MSKRGRKSSIKTTSDIVAFLQKHYKKRYSDSKFARATAKEIRDSIKKSKESLNIKNILSRVRRPRNAKPTAVVTPFINPKLLEPCNYWEIEDYPALIQSSSNEIYFVSDLWPASMEDIQGGTTPDYDEYFSYIVAFLNGASAADSNKMKYKRDWKVVCTSPKINPANKRWESKVITISIDDEGVAVETDYGFNPNDPNTIPFVYPSPNVGAPAELKKVEPEKIAPKGQEEIKEPETKGGLKQQEVELKKQEVELKKQEVEIKKQEVEIKKQENIAKAFSMFENNKIDKQTLELMLKAIG